MSEMHELLAVEKDVKRSEADAVKAFSKMSEAGALFQGMARTLSMFDEERAKQENGRETQEMQAVFGDEFGFAGKAVARAIDVELQKDITNCNATADIVVDGKVIAKAVPATFLLYAERKLEEFGKMLARMPIRSTEHKWEASTEHDEGIFLASQDPTFKTKKIFRFHVMVQPTEYHPAQVKEWPEEDRVGKYETTIYTSLMSKNEKTLMQERCGKLLVAVKKARARANKTETSAATIGREFMAYITG